MLRYGNPYIFTARSSIIRNSLQQIKPASSIRLATSKCFTIGFHTAKQFIGDSVFITFLRAV